MSDINPVPLQTWAKANVPEKTMIFFSSYWPQIIFVRDELPKLLANTYEDYKRVSDNINVVSTHTSKSILLPVMEITLPSGVKFLLRNNFHNWIISVESPKPLVIDFKNLISPDNVPPIYCQGFTDDRVHPAYSLNHSRFTVELHDRFEVYTFFWLIGNALDLNRNK